MSSKYVIKTYPNNPRVWKSLIAAKLNGVNVAEQAVSMKDREHKAPEFLAVNPYGKVPTLFHEDGKDGVFESASILRYVARLGNDKYPLYGSNALEASKIDAWLDVGIWAEKAVGPWYAPKIGYGTYDAAKEAAAIEETKTILEGLNKALVGKDFLVANHITIADISLSLSLLNPFKHVFSREFISQFPEVNRWWDNLLKRDEFKAVIGEVEVLKNKA